MKTLFETSKLLSNQVEEIFNQFPTIFQSLVEEYQEVDSVLEDYLYDVDNDYFNIFTKSGYVEDGYIGSFITNNDFICILFKHTYTDHNDCNQTDIVDIYFPSTLFDDSILENIKNNLKEQAIAKKKVDEHIAKQKRDIEYQTYLDLKKKFEENE